MSKQKELAVQIAKAVEAGDTAAVSLLLDKENQKVAATEQAFRWHLRMLPEPLIYVRAHTRQWQAKWKKPKPPKPEVKFVVMKFRKHLVTTPVGTIYKP